jgi:hypothetical protein
MKRTYRKGNLVMRTENHFHALSLGYTRDISLDKVSAKLKIKSVPQIIHDAMPLLKRQVVLRHTIY